MDVWICNACHAEMRSKKKPSSCELCTEDRGFYKAAESDPTPLEQKNTKKYDEAVASLEKYNEGTEPEKLKYSGFKEEEE